MIDKMLKNKDNTKVKKSVLRNCEKRVSSATNCKPVLIKANPKSASELGLVDKSTHQLDRPTLCSSVSLAAYINDVKNSHPPINTSNEDDTERSHIREKVTKKLNFHLNDKMYKNLIELNNNSFDLQPIKSRRSLAVPTKKDLEPNIEDFFENNDESDSDPSIPAIKPKFKPLRQIQKGDLHRLVSSFEVL